MSQVLYVDDEPVRNTETLEALRQRFDVTVFERAKAAIEWIRTLDPLQRHLLLWDLQIPVEPGMDAEATAYGTRTGLMVHAAWRKRLPRHPAILLSHVQDDALFTKIRAGAFDRAAHKWQVTPEVVVEWVAEDLLLAP